MEILAIYKDVMFIYPGFAGSTITEVVAANFEDLRDCPDLEANTELFYESYQEAYKASHLKIMPEEDYNRQFASWGTFTSRRSKR
jgi:hypothetical protein